MSRKESVKGADTVLRGSVRALEGFSEGKPEAAKPRGRICQGFSAEGLPEENPEAALTLPRPKDFRQLLRLPISQGLLANEASLHTVL